MASVAGRAQLRNEQFEFVASFFAARVEGELRSLCGSLIKIREIGPDIRRSERIRRGVPIGSRRPLIRSGWKHVRECHQPGRDCLCMLLAPREIKLAFRREHGLDLVHIQVDRAHHDLAGYARIPGRRHTPSFQNKNLHHPVDLHWS